MFNSNRTTRRGLITGIMAMGLLAGCGNGIGSDGGQKIDAAADAALNYLYGTEPGARDLAARASGMLIMPDQTQGGFGFGAAFGRGVLRIGDASVDYYSSTQASFGLQIGAQKYSHVLFFMTDDALADFRASSGWTAGAGVRYTIQSESLNVDVGSTQILSPVEAIIFAQAGAIAGATLEGTKYTRIIP